MNIKGQGGLNFIPSIVLALVLGGVFAVVGVLIMNNLKSGFVGNTTESNVTNNALAGLAGLTSQFTTIGIISGLGILISVVIFFFVMRGMRQ